MSLNKILTWAMRITIAYLFLQTLSFKFTAHPESVYIFSKLGLEPYGRIGTGIAELIASFLILWNRTKVIGIIMSFFIITGALASHFLVLGIKVDGERVLLFVYALIIFCFDIILAVLFKKDIIEFVNKMKRKNN